MSSPTSPQARSGNAKKPGPQTPSHDSGKRPAEAKKPEKPASAAKPTSTPSKPASIPAKKPAAQPVTPARTPRVSAPAATKGSRPTSASSKHADNKVLSPRSSATHAVNGTSKKAHVEGGEKLNAEEVKEKAPFHEPEPAQEEKQMTEPPPEAIPSPISSDTDFPDVTDIDEAKNRPKVSKLPLEKLFEPKTSAVPGDPVQADVSPSGAQSKPAQELDKLRAHLKQLRNEVSRQLESISAFQSGRSGLAFFVHSLFSSAEHKPRSATPENPDLLPEFLPNASSSGSLDAPSSPRSTSLTPRTLSRPIDTPRTTLRKQLHGKPKEQAIRHLQQLYQELSAQIETLDHNDHEGGGSSSDTVAATKREKLKEEFLHIAREREQTALKLQQYDQELELARVHLVEAGMEVPVMSHVSPKGSDTCAVQADVRALSERGKAVIGELDKLREFRSRENAEVLTELHQLKEENEMISRELRILEEETLRVSMHVDGLCRAKDQAVQAKELAEEEVRKLTEKLRRLEAARGHS